MTRRQAEERYELKLNKQRKQLDDFSEHETEWAGHLMTWYGYKKQEMPDDEYRACVFFLNKEYLHKPESLTLLYMAYERCNGELPEVSKETAFDCLRRVRSTLRQIPYLNSNPLGCCNSAAPLPYVRKNA